MNAVAAELLIPEGALGALSGEDANGTWALRVRDDATVDTGTLNSWSLLVSYCEDNQPGIVQSEVHTETPEIPTLLTDGVPIDSVITVAGHEGEICSAELKLKINHTFAADLDITLTSPEGTTTIITTDNGGGNDNVFSDTVFADLPGLEPASDFVYTNGVAAAGLVPEGAMSAFVGQSPNGDWTLHIEDDVAGDNGELVEWSVVITSCDTDSDGDTIVDQNDNCPDAANTLQTDSDGDGLGDACDLCPSDAAKSAPGICGCGVVDADTDSDGAYDCNENCISDPAKTDPGVCGCGIADADNDGSGIVDCLFAAEANNIATNFGDRIGALKYSKKAKKKKATKSEIAALLTEIDAFIGYVETNASGIVFAQGSDLGSTQGLTNTLKKQLRSLKGKLKKTRRLFKKTRKQAVKSAQDVASALPV